MNERHYTVQQQNNQPCWLISISIQLQTKLTFTSAKKSMV